MEQVAAALTALQNGDPVLVYDADGREAEVDLVYAAEQITAENIARLRNDAGGLICTAIPADAAEILGFPLIADVLTEELVESPGDLSYDARSSFSYWINHVDTTTGITDCDRSLTARKLAAAVKTVQGNDVVRTADEFRTPGHMAVLRAADTLLDERQGHTELSVYLAAAAGMVPATVICEMLDDETGAALPRQQAEDYAATQDLVMLDGATILHHWKQRRGSFSVTEK